ncbi:hypothetical protein [Actinomadura hibisca]|uniref:hypothetical protein n=1 Tax=Actinomadura hibisca TaxID=68565 RepID=UPI0012FAA2CD|nr:hypothetical protein [Actinomadura hibisca]
MIIVYAGRRTLADPGRTARALGRFLDHHRPRLVVGSAAAGTDLLLLEEAGRREVPAHVVLLGDAARFREVSVADLGAEWTGRYDRIVADPSVTLSFVPGTDDGGIGHRAVNDLIVAVAGEAGERVEAVVVQSRDLPGGEVTGHLARSCRERGWPVTELPAC